MSGRDEFLAWVNSVQKDAEIALHNGEVGPRRAIWSATDPVTLFGAWLSASGAQDVNRVFEQLAESMSHCASYEMEIVAADVSGDLAYLVCYEHTSATIDGVPRRYTLRVTQVYRRENGAWKVVHRHGDEVTSPPA